MDGVEMQGGMDKRSEGCEESVNTSSPVEGQTSKEKRQIKGDSPGNFETLMAFCKRARNFLLGRETILRRRHQLHFILMTRDISENSRKEILYKFRPYPIVHFGVSEEICRLLGIHNAKVIGFTKGGLSQSLYRCLKSYRIENTQEPPSGTVSRKAPGKESRKGSKKKANLAPDSPGEITMNDSVES